MMQEHVFAAQADEAQEASAVVVRGREIQVELLCAAGQEAPPVALTANGRRVATSTTWEPRPGAEHSTWLVRLRIPDALYDGRTHELTVEVGTAARRRIGSVRFIGAPSVITAEAALAARPEPGPVAPAVPAADPASAPAPAASMTPHAAHAETSAIMESLAVQTAALRRLLEQALPPVAADPPAPVPVPPPSLSDRYGALHAEAVGCPAVRRDVIWLGVIDWRFRIQRPQHLAAGLAAAGSRVFYISIVFGDAAGGSRLQFVSTPAPGVFEVQLRLWHDIPSSIYGGFTDAQVEEITASLDELIGVAAVREPVVVVQYPSWHPVAVRVPGATIVHDCLDLVSGFDNVPAAMVDLEHRLVEQADLLITTSLPLQEHVGKYRSSTIIRNAADVGYFAAGHRPGPANPRPVIGYFGALAHWFEADWIAQAADAHPEWDFVLIGAITEPSVEALRGIANVHCLGEVPYHDLIPHLRAFDVAVIPFKLLDLILCTNPVKLYEYMAAGKPVVASRMPEVVAATDLVYLADDARHFQAQIARALGEDSEEKRAERMRWAQEHTWSDRADRMLTALEPLSPKVSVVILAYNNWAFTEAAMHSALVYSDYANLEIIVVDNGSSDGSDQRLRGWAKRDPRIKIVLTGFNHGFAGGNNIGMREATGEFIILLNNDTYVTRGWVRELIRPMQIDPGIGATSPITNNIGNEQKVTIHYHDMPSMAVEARRVVRRRPRRRLETECVAFFCVAVRREAYEKVGGLDEAYGLGFFEDDDYCRQLMQAGYRIAIVDDCFVHHHLSASFDKLGNEERHRQMDLNRAIYEAKWGPWRPHEYRKEPGFG